MARALTLRTPVATHLQSKICHHFAYTLSLILLETTIGTDGASTIFSALQNLPLTNLSLDYNKIGSKTTFSLLPMNTLVELDLSSIFLPFFRFIFLSAYIIYQNFLV